MVIIISIVVLVISILFVLSSCIISGRCSRKEEQDER